MIKKRMFKFFVIICFSLSPVNPVSGDVQPPQDGQTLPDILLSSPETDVHLKYLGLKADKKTFAIPDIKAEVLIIEIFSMYCPHCQQDANAVNEMYKKIENNKELKNMVKIIGIGVGNSDLEVEMFRNKYNIQFPLFSDNDFSVHKKLGEVRTPYFIVIKISKNRTHQVVYSKLGAVKDKENFLQFIHKTAKE